MHSAITALLEGPGVAGVSKYAKACAYWHDQRHARSMPITSYAPSVLGRLVAWRQVTRTEAARALARLRFV